MAGNASGKFDFCFFVGLKLKGLKNVLGWCRTMQLIASEFECPECKSQMKLEERSDDIDGYVWVCRQDGENGHLVEISVRQGSFFQRSDLSIIKILLLTYLWIKKSTCEFIEDELELSKETVEEWLHFFREVCVEICLSKNTAIGGENVAIEIDECKFQKKDFKRNNYVVGEWAYVGYDKDSDKGFLKIVKEKSEKELLNAIKEYILPGSILISDCWKLYGCLDEKEFKDLKKSHHIKYVDFGAIGIGQSTIGLRRSIKRTINDDPRVCIEFDLFVAEYMWRRLNSDNPYYLIRSFLKEIVKLFPFYNQDMDVVAE